MKEIACIIVVWLLAATIAHHREIAVRIDSQLREAKLDAQAREHYERYGVSVNDVPVPGGGILPETESEDADDSLAKMSGR